LDDHTLSGHKSTWLACQWLWKSKSNHRNLYAAACSSSGLLRAHPAKPLYYPSTPGGWFKWQLQSNFPGQEARPYIDVYLPVASTHLPCSSQASATAKMREVISIHIGQAGIQVTPEQQLLLADERASFWLKGRLRAEAPLPIPCPKLTPCACAPNRSAMPAGNFTAWSTVRTGLSGSGAGSS